MVPGHLLLPNGIFRDIWCIPGLTWKHNMSNDIFQDSLGKNVYIYELCRLKCICTKESPGSYRWAIKCTYLLIYVYSTGLKYFLTLENTVRKCEFKAFRRH